MFKKMISFILALSILMGLCVNGWAAAANYNDEELDRAIAYGFGEYRTGNAATTYQEFMKMLDRAVALSAPDKSAQWAKRFPEARQSASPMDKGNAALAVFAAAEALGGEVYSRNRLDEGQGRHDGFTPSPYWGDVRRVPVGFEGMEESAGEPFLDWALHYVTYRGSLISGRTIFEFDAQGVFHAAEPLSYTDALRAALRFYESAIDLSERYPNADDEKLLAEVEAKKRSILNSKTDVAYTGTAYYVSNDGNDKNSGASPQQAWATTERVNAAKYDGTLKRGDAVFFERGGLWRGWIDCAVGVTYSAYGTGEKPKIYGSSEDGAGADKWELWYDQSGVKIWKYYRDMTEVGNIVFDGGDSYATRIYSYYNGQSWVVSGANQRPFNVTENLKDDLTFYSTYDLSRAELKRYAAQMGGTAYADTIHKAGPLYLRCDAGNPGALYQEIEFHQMPEDMNGYIGLVTPAGDNVIDNLCIKYCMVNGIAIYGSDNENSDNNNNVIQNCEVGWHGGTQHDLNRSTGDVMVCGEAIVFKTDYNVFRNNYVYQATQGSFVCEFVDNEWLTSTSAVGNVIEGNIIEHSPYCFWFWDNGGSQLGAEYVFFKDTTIRGNYVMYMGDGWYNEAKCEYQESVMKGYEGENLSFSFNANGTSAVRNMNITDNVFYLAKSGVLIMAFDSRNITFSGNTYVQADNRKILSGNILAIRLTAAEIKAGIAEILGDKTAKVFATSVKPPVTGAPAVSTAYPSTQTVEVDGKKVTFQMYALLDGNGYQTNYIKVRDLALALNGTKAQFNVGWNGEINLETGKAYVPNGSENSTPFSGARAYTVNTGPTNVNGAAVDLAGILLKDDAGGGYTYCQLKDLGVKLNFNVAWSYGRGIYIETDKPYSGN